MANDNQELAILLRAQNLTQQAFDQARKDIANLGQSTGKTTDAMGLLTKGLGAFGITLGATAVVSFAKDILDTAGNIADLSAALGISTDAVQDFKSSAEDSGATIDNVGQAIQKLNDEAASNSDAFAKLGLNIDDVLALSPEDRFREVANALKQIEDPAVRAARGHDLLGKSYDALAASIDNGIGEMSDSNKMSKETIDTLDELGDGIGHVLTSLKNFGGTAIAGAFNQFTGMLKQSRDELKQLGVANDAVMKALGIDADAAKEKVKDLWETYKVFRDGVTNTPKVGVPSLFSGQGAPKPTRLGKEEEEQIVEALNKERKGLDEVAKAADAHTQKIQQMQDALFGRTAIAQANDYLQALGKFSNLTRVSAEDQKKLNDAAKAALDAVARNGEKASAAMLELYNRTVALPPLVDTLTLSVKDFGHEVDLVIPQLYEMPKAIAFTPEALREIEKEAKIAIPQIPKEAKVAQASIGDLAQAISQMANVAGGSFSSVARDLGSIVTAADTAVKSIHAIRDAGKATDKLDGILSMTTGIMGIVSAALQAGKAIAALFDRNKGRDLVVDFADTFGGFDLLHQQLLALGDAGEQLWIKLTQGVGRNNPQQAQQVIDEVTAALEKQKQKQDDVQDVTEDAALATIETATQASQALDLVGEKLQTNVGQWSDWSAAVMAEIDKVARSVGAVVVPTPGGSSSGGGSVGGGGGTSGSGAPIVVQVDGREIARTSAQYQKSVLSPYGVR